MAIVWKGKIGYDDTLDVMGTHGIAGVLGMLGVGLRVTREEKATGLDLTQHNERAYSWSGPVHDK